MNLLFNLFVLDVRAVFFAVGLLLLTSTKASAFFPVRSNPEHDTEQVDYNQRGQNFAETFDEDQVNLTYFEDEEQPDGFRPMTTRHFNESETGFPDAVARFKKPKHPGQRPGSVILVGNGKSLLRKKLGGAIDAFDVVGRFNYFRLKGHEANVGRKTTLWFLGELKTPKAKEFDRSVSPERYVVPVSWPVKKGCKKCGPTSKAKKQGRVTRSKVLKKWASAGLSKKLEIVPDGVQFALRMRYKYRQQWPSTGLIAIAYCLHFYKPPITITGFDFGSARKKDCGWTGCSSKLLGHWFQKRYKSHTVHNMYAEGAFIKMLRKRGLVKVL